MHRLLAFILVVLLSAAGCGRRAPVESETAAQPLGQEIRPRVELTDNVTRTSRGFELDGGEGPAASWAQGFRRSGLVEFKPVQLEKPVEHLGVHFGAERPDGTLAVLQVRGSLDGRTWTDWADVDESGFIRLTARSQYIALRLLLAGNDEVPWVRDLALTALPSAVTVSVQVRRLPDSGAVDMSKPLPPIPGATVEVVELGLKATADQEGRVSFTLPLGDNPPGEAVYTFEASAGEWPYRTAVRERLTAYGSGLAIHYNARRHVYMDVSYNPRGTVVDVIRQKLQPLSAQEAVAVKDRWDVPGYAVFCTGDTAPHSGAFPVLICQWGRGFNAMFDGRYIFWQEDGGHWNAQPFPDQAVRGIGYFRELRRAGEYLAVVMDTARGMTGRAADEVVLLRRTAGWRLVWQPEGQGDPAGGAAVRFEGSGLDRFSVIRRREDPGAPALRERWQRDGDRYQLLSVLELTPEEEQDLLEQSGD